MNDNSTNIESIFANFLRAIVQNKESQLPLVKTMCHIYTNQYIDEIIRFDLDDTATNNAINQIKTQLGNQNLKAVQQLNTPLTYLLDELICNIQQHAQTDKGLAFVNYNQNTDNVEIIIADTGITIYGGYVAAQKHLDKLGDSDAYAIDLARKGYSIKNLPNVENRGYGISSNIKMVVNGLGGEFAIFSGNALLLCNARSKIILSLPDEIDYKGTMIVVTIPTDIPSNFNLYNYTF